MLQAASIVCPGKKGQISNISPSTNTVAKCCQVIYMINCVRKPNTCSIALNDITDNAQLAICLWCWQEFWSDRSCSQRSQSMARPPLRRYFANCVMLLWIQVCHRRGLLWKMPLMCFKCSSLSFSAIQNSKTISGRWVESQTSLDNFWENCPQPSLSFSGCSSGTCAFLGAHICVKRCSLPWTLISQSTYPNVLRSIFKPYWGSQLLHPWSQMWLSCVRSSTARFLAARSKQEKPMFWRTCSCWRTD